MYLTILQQILFLLLWSGCHRCREWILCWVVASSCWPTHNIVHHISWHNLPNRRTMKKYEDFPSMVFFSCSCGNPGFKHGSIIVNNTTAYSKYTWSRKDVDSPKSTSLLSTFHIGLRICFFPANLMSSTHTVQNDPFSRSTNKHSQLETFSHSFSKKDFLRLLFSLQSCSRMTIQISFKGNDWVFHTGPWIWAICVVVEESICLDTPILEFSIICEHLPFLPGC